MNSSSQAISNNANNASVHGAPAGKLMVMAGGTGGHVFPALSVALALREQGTQVTWLGTRKGLEARVVPANQLDMQWISIDGLRGKHALSWIVAPFKLLRAVVQSVLAIRRIKPDCVLGMGGFVAGPGGLAAGLTRTPLVIHEQNAVAGLTNKYLAKFASRVLTGFPQAQDLPKSAQWVGNPVRPEIIAVGKTSASKADYSDPVCNVLVVGGSQGAWSFNQHLPSVFKAQSASINIWHQTGKGNAESVKAKYQALAVNADVSDFIEDMAAAYAWADLLICRAGAMTIAECCAAAKPALLIPYPFSAGNHQDKNAAAMVAVGGAKMLENTMLAEPEMVSVLAELLAEKSQLASMGHAANKLYKADALQSVVSVCQEYLHA